jgi:hypothetical protein
MIDKIFSNIDYIFLQLKNTKGEFSKTFSQIKLNILVNKNYSKASMIYYAT